MFCGTFMGHAKPRLGIDSTVFLQLVATCGRTRVAIDSPPKIIRTPSIVTRLLPSW